MPTEAAAALTVRLPVTIDTHCVGCGTEGMELWFYSVTVMRIEVAHNAGRGLPTQAAAERAARKAVREWAARQSD